MIFTEGSSDKLDEDPSVFGAFWLSKGAFLSLRCHKNQSLMC